MRDAGQSRPYCRLVSKVGVFTPRPFTFLIQFALGSTSCIHAQVTKDLLTGIVFDATGGVLPGVDITIRNQDANETRAVVTSEIGRFYAPHLAPGNYDLQASLSGFKAGIVKDIVLTVKQARRVDIILENQKSEKEHVRRSNSRLHWRDVSRGTVWFLSVAALILLSSTSALTQSEDTNSETNTAIWKGPGGKPLPFQTHEEMKEFLRTAEVVEMEDIPTGVTHPRKATLEKDGVRLHATFRDVDIYKQKWDDPKRGPRMDFRDDCVYECAAYELSVLLGMDNVPPTVPRTIENKEGTIQFWIEDAMTEANRAASDAKPPFRWRWLMQQQVMELFDQLIFNDDRNQGNMLIDKDWKVWLIDHTRAFRTYSKPYETKLIRYCEKNIWEGMQNLKKEDVEEKLGPYLSKGEMEGLLKRNKALVKHISKLIKQHGEKGVIFIFRET